MNVEFDYDLTADQWEMLRGAPRARHRIARASIDPSSKNLVALQLAEIAEGCPQITPKGRSVLLRGSPRLLDVAA